MAGCSALLTVDVFTNKFYCLEENQLLSLGGDDTETLSGGDGVYIKIVGSSHGWIALYKDEEEEDSVDLFLWNPVTRRRINLPRVNNLPGFKYCPPLILKLILSSSNPEDADCRVVVRYFPGDRLAFCCPGQSGAGWISIGTWYDHNVDDRVKIRGYADMAYSSQQNRLFCTTGYPLYELERWDLEDPGSPRIDGDDSRQDREEVIHQYEDTEYKEGEDRCIYVVIVEDEVLVVVRKLYSGAIGRDGNFNDPHKTTGFIIFKVDQGEGGNLTVHPLHSLDSGLAMFIGLNHSFVLSATEFSELKPNSIYFTDAYNPIKSIWWRSVCCLSQYDIGIFDYQNRIFYPCSSLQEHNHEEEEEDSDGSDEEHNGEESEEERDRDLLKLVWFRPLAG